MSISFYGSHGLKMTTPREDLAGYSASKLRSDMVAGLTVATFSIPQSMAYAELAGIPLHYGLYSAIVVTIVASIFNSCSRLIYGPTNVICIMIADIQLLHLMEEYSIGVDQFMQVVFLLTLMVGLVQFFGAICGFGRIGNYISPSVIVGFTLAAATLIVVFQIPRILNIDLPEDLSSVDLFGLELPVEMPALRSLIYAVQHLDESHGPTLLVGLGCTVFILTYRRLRPLVLAGLETAKRGGSIPARILRNAPGALFAIVIASAVVALLDLDVELALRTEDLEDISRLPIPSASFLSAPLLQMGLIRALFPAAVAIALVGLIEAVATARNITMRTREPFDPNDQLLAEGLANTAGAFFSCFTGASSFTRSALNVDVGALTRMSGIFCGLFVALFLLLLMPLLALIPMAALSGVLIAVAFTLIQTHRIVYTFRASRTEALIVTATALWGILFGLEGGVVVGVVLSILAYMPQAATLNLRHLIRDAGGVIREKEAEEPSCSRLGILDIEGTLFFGSLPALERGLTEFAEEPLTHKILRIHNAHHVDAAITDALEHFIAGEQAKGVAVALCGVRRRQEGILARVGLLELLGPDNVFLEKDLSRPSTVQAVRSAYLRIGDHECPLCGTKGQPGTNPGIGPGPGTFTYMI